MILESFMFSSYLEPLLHFSKNDYAHLKLKQRSATVVTGIIKLKAQVPYLCYQI